MLSSDNRRGGTQWRHGLVFAAGFVLASFGCAKEAPEKTVLQTLDLEEPNAEFADPFDPEKIVDFDAFTDVHALDETLIQQFFERTPYKRPSFLATYQSNGLTAAAAIMRAARKHRINPFAFLVRAQMDQGLLGEQFYPFPPVRVEYVFQCGCLARDICDPALAGFDIQVDCLGAALRKNLDDIDAKGQTAGGWAPEAPSRTLDGKVVTPADPATAALYDYGPRVSVKAGGGTWVFWRLWLLYTEALQYTGPIGNSGGTAWIGDACAVDRDCMLSGATCLSQTSGEGICSLGCTGECPSQEGRVPTFCASFGGTAGFCMAACDPNVAASCRTGFECRSVARFGNRSEAKFVCVPG
jgi:hypothetical protein